MSRVLDHGNRVHSIRFTVLGRLGLRPLPKRKGFRAPHTSFLKMAKDANEDLSDPCAVGQTHPIFDHPLAARGEMQWVRITLKSGCWGPTIVKYISNVFGERQDVKTEDYLLYMLYRYFGTHTTVK